MQLLKFFLAALLLAQPVLADSPGKDKAKGGNQPDSKAVGSHKEQPAHPDQKPPAKGNYPKTERKL